MAEYFKSITLQKMRRKKKGKRQPQWALEGETIASLWERLDSTGDDALPVLIGTNDKGLEMTLRPSGTRGKGRWAIVDKLALLSLVLEEKEALHLRVRPPSLISFAPSKEIRRLLSHC